MRTESSYNTKAVSGVGARGLIQIMPATGRRIANHLNVANFSSEDLNEPGVNVRFAAWYFKFLRDHFKGNEALAIAAYNAGPEAVGRWIRQNPQLVVDEFLENIPFDETWAYVKKVIYAKDMYLRIYSGQKLKWEPWAALPKNLREDGVF